MNENISILRSPNKGTFVRIKKPHENCECKECQNIEPLIGKWFCEDALGEDANVWYLILSKKINE